MQKALVVQTRGRGTYEISSQVGGLLDGSLATGLCHVFVEHTSASLILCENADPSVRHDLETFASRLAPDGDAMFTHTAEGPDDMAAHVRSVFTNAGLTIPIRSGRLALGTWQGLYLWEHRTGPHLRRLTITTLGS